MQNSFDTSFIPQQPLLKVEGFERRHESINLALVLSLVAFFVVLIVATGIYFFHNKVEKEVHDLSVQLQEKEAILDVDEIKRLKDVDLRIVAAQKLLRNHTVFTIVLDFLEQGTLQNVGLTSLSYTSSDKGSAVSLNAVAPSYQAVYLQGETWRAMKPLVVDADITSVVLLENTGIVTFSAKIILNHNLSLYEKFIQTLPVLAIPVSGGAEGIQAAPSASASPTTP